MLASTGPAVAATAATAGAVSLITLLSVKSCGPRSPYIDQTATGLTTSSAPARHSHTRQLQPWPREVEREDGQKTHRNIRLFHSANTARAPTGTPGQVIAAINYLSLDCSADGETPALTAVPAKTHTGQDKIQL